MLDVIIETLVDSLKILPFLFLTYLLIEYMEHKAGSKINNALKKSNGVKGPIIGSILGLLPQCGFSVSAANLYAGRVISLGTLISVFLATSDEMLPILIINGASLALIAQILAIKLIIGMIAGIVIDIFIKKSVEDKIHDICEETHCHCEKGILRSAIKHTLSIFFFIIIISFVLNITVDIIGVENLSVGIMQNKFIGPVIAMLIGLIPNCVATVFITELYLSGSILIGSLFAGTLMSAGVGFLVLFRVNKNIKENIKIIEIMSIISIIVGILINLVI